MKKHVLWFIFLIFRNAAMAGSIISQSIPSGAIIISDSLCPGGYSELTVARGRYLVGVPSGGTILGTVGTPLNNQQDLTHTHTVSSVTATNLSLIGAGIGVASINGTSSGAATSSVAPYLQIRLCKKD